MQLLNKKQVWYTGYSRPFSLTKSLTKKIVLFPFLSVCVCVCVFMCVCVCVCVCVCAERYYIEPDCFNSTAKLTISLHCVFSIKYLSSIIHSNIRIY